MRRELSGYMDAQMFLTTKDVQGDSTREGVHYFAFHSTTRTRICRGGGAQHLANGDFLAELNESV